VRDENESGKIPGMRRMLVLCVVVGSALLPQAGAGDSQGSASGFAAALDGSVAITLSVTDGHGAAVARAGDETLVTIAIDCGVVYPGIDSGPFVYGSGVGSDGRRHYFSVGDEWLEYWGPDTVGITTQRSPGAPCDAAPPVVHATSWLVGGL
jgi:hypothetical protein